MTSEEILDKIFGYDFTLDTRTLDKIFQCQQAEFRRKKTLYF